MNIQAAMTQLKIINIHRLLKLPLYWYPMFYLRKKPKMFANPEHCPYAVSYLGWQPGGSSSLLAGFPSYHWEHCMSVSCLLHCNLSNQAESTSNSNTQFLMESYTSCSSVLSESVTFIGPFNTKHPPDSAKSLISQGVRSHWHQIYQAGTVQSQ